MVALCGGWRKTSGGYFCDQWDGPAAAGMTDQAAQGGEKRVPSASTASVPGTVVTQTTASSLPPSTRSSLSVGTNTMSPPLSALR